MDEEQSRAMDVNRWEEGYQEGFYGILTNPIGEKGFLSRVGTSTEWTPIGKGQDPVEVMKIARKLHDAILSPGTMEPDDLLRLGEELRRLSKPKEAKQG